MTDKEKYSDNKYAANKYAVPYNVCEFMTSNNSKLPEGFELLPWTTAQSVSLFDGETYVSSISYKSVEDGIQGELLKLMLEEYAKKAHNPPPDVTIRRLSTDIHKHIESLGWHNKTPLEACALICSEVGEAVNELRGKEPTDKYGEELADIILRTLDEAKERGIDITIELLKKMDKNKKLGTKGRVK